MDARGHSAPEVGPSAQPGRVEPASSAHIRPAPQAGQQTGAPPGSPPLSAALARGDEGPFVGRSAALAQLQDCWRRGVCGLVLVCGEAGIGKTRLSARFAAGVHADGGVVLRGHADEQSVWPYQAFVEALRHYVSHRPNVVAEARVPPAAASVLASLLPELEAPAPLTGAAERDGNRHALFEAIVRLLLHAAHPSGVLIILEDLHWADEATTL